MIQMTHFPPAPFVANVSLQTDKANLSNLKLHTLRRRKPLLESAHKIKNFITTFAPDHVEWIVTIKIQPN